MNEADRILVFTLDGQRYGLHLSVVEKIISLVDITRLPESSIVVQGVINMHGNIIPVLDLRALFGLPAREPELSDRLIIARTSDRPVAFHADTVAGVVLCPEGAMVSSDSILTERSSLEGIAVIEDGMVLITDLDRFLTIEQKAFLALPLSYAGGPEPPPPEQKKV